MDERRREIGSDVFPGSALPYQRKPGHESCTADIMMLLFIGYLSEQKDNFHASHVQFGSISISHSLSNGA